MGVGGVVMLSPVRPWGMTCSGPDSLHTYGSRRESFDPERNGLQPLQMPHDLMHVTATTSGSDRKPQVRGGVVQHTTSWHIEVLLYEDGDRTRAEAVLRTSAGTELRSEGIASRNPKDTDVPEIGEELATSRALSGLAHALFEATVADIEQNVHRPVRLES